MSQQQRIQALHTAVQRVYEDAKNVEVVQVTYSMVQDKERSVCTLVITSGADGAGQKTVSKNGTKNFRRRQRLREEKNKTSTSGGVMTDLATTPTTTASAITPQPTTVTGSTYNASTKPISVLNHTITAVGGATAVPRALQVTWNSSAWEGKDYLARLGCQDKLQNRKLLGKYHRTKSDRNKFPMFSKETHGYHIVIFVDDGETGGSNRGNWVIADFSTLSTPSPRDLAHACVVHHRYSGAGGDQSINGYSSRIQTPSLPPRDGWESNDEYGGYQQWKATNMISIIYDS